MYFEYNNEYEGSCQIFYLFEYQFNVKKNNVEKK